MAIEKSLFIIKPEARIIRGAEERILKLLKKGFDKVEHREFYPTIDQIKEHYKEHEGKYFYATLIEHITGGEEFDKIMHALNIQEGYRGEYSGVIAGFVTGNDAIARLRKYAGSTRPNAISEDKERGRFSIRGQYLVLDKVDDEIFGNIIHSTAKEDATTEIPLWESYLNL